jgi:hypothetical protein
MLAAAVLILASAGWFTYRWLSGGPELLVEITDVAGYTDDVPVWMPFRLTLRLANAGDQSITIRRIDVEPDLDEVNEAYSAGSPYDLSPPMLLDPGVSRSHELSVTVLNANQLPERTYMLVFTLRMRTDAGVIVRRFPAELRYFRDPARRELRRPASAARGFGEPSRGPRGMLRQISAWRPL